MADDVAQGSERSQKLCTKLARLAAERGLSIACAESLTVRMRFHRPTIDYVARRTAEGKTKREIIRCLKRYVIREVYHLLRPAP